MSIKTGDGSVAYAGGLDTVDETFSLVTAPLTLTNALQAYVFIAASNAYVWQVGTRGYRQVRLTGRIATVSASANSPRLQLRYSAAMSVTVADFLIMGSTSVEISMFTGQVMADSGWIDILPAARLANCFLGLFNIGGDGAADPIVSNVVAHFR